MGNGFWKCGGWPRWLREEGICQAKQLWPPSSRMNMQNKEEGDTRDRETEGDRHRDIDRDRERDRKMGLGENRENRQQEKWDFVKSQNFVNRKYTGTQSYTEKPS